jgi:hypothetical protein
MRKTFAPHFRQSGRTIASIPGLKVVVILNSLRGITGSNVQQQSLMRTTVANIGAGRELRLGGFDRALLVAIMSRKFHDS